MFFVNYLPEFLHQPLKLSNVRPTDFANSKHAKEFKKKQKSWILNSLRWNDKFKTFNQ